MKIALLLSGGVDSSVALSLLKDKGHDLTAYYIKIWLEDEVSYLGECPWEEDLNYAKAVCEKLNVPLAVVSCQKEYLDRVVDYTLAELRHGRTPSPDIFCNSRIKFDAFMGKIPAGFEKIATGHYAKVEQGPDGWKLKCSPDPVKDQTYFLCHLSQSQLARACFPLGAFKKTDIRAIAREKSLPTMERKDSQGICFLGQIKFDEFIKFHLGEQEGDIRDVSSGAVLGMHRGYWFHTIGQRHGLGLSGGPWYVVKKDVSTNTIYVAHKDILSQNSKNTFNVTGTHWISGKPPKKENLTVKVRHGETIYQARVTPSFENAYTVCLEKPDAGIASGQFSVFYDGDECLGCGVIQ